MKTLTPGATGQGPAPCASSSTERSARGGACTADTLPLGVLMALGLVPLLLWRMVFVILPGEVGYSLLGGGTVLDEVLPEGFALKLPWDKVYIYETRTQRFPFQLYGLSREGMTVQMVGTLLYRPTRELVPILQKTIGPEYRDRIVAASRQAALREIIARYKFPHELYRWTTTACAANRCTSCAATRRAIWSISRTC